MNQCDDNCRGACIEQGDDVNDYIYNGTCRLQNCKNYPFCKEQRPQQILDVHGDFCLGCAMIMRYKQEAIINECPICQEEKILIKLKCGHLICRKCWYNICKTADENIEENEYHDEEGSYIEYEFNDLCYHKCPLCRQKD